MNSRTILRVMTWILALGILAGCGRTADSFKPGQSPAEIDTVANPMMEAWGDPTPFAAGLSTDPGPALALLPDATEYHFDLVLDDDLTGLSGQMTLRFTNPLPIPLDALYFRLYPNISGGELDDRTDQGRRDRRAGSAPLRGFGLSGRAPPPFASSGSRRR